MILHYVTLLKLPQQFSQYPNTFFLKVTNSFFSMLNLFLPVSCLNKQLILFFIVFKDKHLNTTLSKRTLKKLLINLCSKTTFSFDNNPYDQMMAYLWVLPWDLYWPISILTLFSDGLLHFLDLKLYKSGNDLNKVDE